MSRYNEILKAKKMQGKSWDELAEGFPIQGNSLRVAFQRGSVDEIYLENVEKILNIHNVQNIISEPKIEYKPEGKIIDVRELPVKDVYVIPIKGKGGFENAYYDDLALKELEIEKLTIKKPSSNGSKWFKIEVDGVSMDDSTEDFEGSKFSLCEGDWTYCRSIPKIHWKNKLHFNSVKVFCFFHNTRGIIFKKVKSHNVENGELILTSLNKDKKQFPDFTINVAECSYICNVIKVLSEF